MSRSITTVLEIAAGLIIGVFLLLLVIGIMSGPASTDNTTPSKNVQAPASAPAWEEPVIRTDVCDFDWTFQTTSYIGNYHTAPVGASYVIVSIYLKNNGDTSISTNPYHWNFVANGIKYTANTATYDSSIRHQTVEVGKGGEIETQIVYLVNGVPPEATLEYNGLSGPGLQKVTHYTLDNILETMQGVTLKQTA